MGIPEQNLLTAGSIVLGHAVDSKGRYHRDTLSGDGIFAAVGARIWSEKVHLIGRVGADFPEHHIQALRDHGIGIDALRIIQGTMQPRIYYQATPDGIHMDPNPASFFRTVGHPIPKPLLTAPMIGQNSDPEAACTLLTPRSEDIPDKLLPCDGAFISGGLYSQMTIPVHLHESGCRTIIIAPPGRSLEPGQEENLPLLLTGITAAIISGEDLPHPRPDTDYLLDTARRLCSSGCTSVVITLGAAGQLLWDQRMGKAFHISAYPARVIDPMGARAGFCGGFLAGLARTGDLLEAAIYGSASASLIIEGTPALHALEALPGLAQARLEHLRGLTRKVPT